MKFSIVRGQDDSIYRIKIQLWGWYRLHIFLRGDHDRAWHDHPHHFWTFPFRSYWEEVLDTDTGKITVNKVKSWRWHYRSAEYSHRLVTVPWPTVTVVREAEDYREWGFWCWEFFRFNAQLYEVEQVLLWKPWRTYLRERNR